MFPIQILPGAEFYYNSLPEESRMKECPTCKRTYADETFAFCLADGTLLSAPFNPKDVARGTIKAESIPTEILPRAVETRHPGPKAELSATIPTPNPQFPQPLARQGRRQRKQLPPAKVTPDGTLRFWR